MDDDGVVGHGGPHPVIVDHHRHHNRLLLLTRRSMVALIQERKKGDVSVRVVCLRERKREERVAQEVGEKMKRKGTIAIYNNN